MALTNKKTGAGNTVETGTEQAKTRKGNEEVIQRGMTLISQMTDEEKALLGSKSGTLHFQHLLGLASKVSRRRVSRENSVDCSTPVGIVLKTDEAIKVPVIDVRKNKDTGVNPETDITYRDVAAGEVFDVTYMEFMFLITRDEYAGLLSKDGVPNEAYFSAKFPAYAKGDAALPTPTINLKNGSVKENMVDIDFKDANGKWAIKEGYERYAEFLTKSRPAKRTPKSSTPAPTAIAVALSKIINQNTSVASKEAK